MSKLHKWVLFLAMVLFVTIGPLYNRAVANQDAFGAKVLMACLLLYLVCLMPLALTICQGVDLKQLAFDLQYDGKPVKNLDSQ